MVPFPLTSGQIIFSTGLLVLSRVVVMDSTFPLEVSAAFNGSVRRPSIDRETVNTTMSVEGPVYAYYSHVANNLTLPVGAKDFLAYTPFQAKKILPANSTLSVEVDVMLPQFECEAAKITMDRVAQDSRSRTPLPRPTFVGPNCTVERVGLQASDPRMVLCPPKQVIAHWGLVDCKREKKTGLGASPWSGDETDIRFMMAVTDFRYARNSTNNRGRFNATDFSTTIKGINGVICKPAYSVHKANLTYNNTSAQDESDRFSIATPKTISGRLLEGFSFDNLSEVVEIALGLTTGVAGFSSSDNWEPEVHNVMSKLMLLTEGESSLQIFLTDVGTMKSAAAKTLNGVAALYAQQSLLKPASEPSTGWIVYAEDRLKVQTTSMALIAACLVILLCLTAVVLFKGPCDVVSRRPDSLAAMAVILTSSQHLQNVLADLGRSPSTTLRQRLSPFDFSTQVGWSAEKGATFGIEVSQTVSSPEVVAESLETHHWHRPLSMRKGFILVILILPLIFIAVLEGLQQASKRQNGFLTLYEDALNVSSSTTMLIRYIPALLGLLLATFFNMLDFTVSTFAPFSRLRAGSSPAQRSISSRLVRQVPPVSLYHAAMEHHWGALFANLAGLTGSVLAIIVSGLLVVEKVNLATGVTVEQLDAFTVDANIANDRNSTMTISLIQQFNLSFPAFTYEELALPALKLSQDSSTVARIAGDAAGPSLSVQVPALRASLDCRQLSQDDIVLSFPYQSRGGPIVDIFAKNTLPEGCSNPARGENLFLHNESFLVANGKGPTRGVRDSDNGWSFAGRIVDLDHVKIKSSDCPSLILFFGSFKVNVTSYENVTVMSCSERIQEVQTSTTFTLPKFAISSSHPPVVNESSTKLLHNTTSNVTALKYSTATKFDNNFIPFFPTSGSVPLYSRALDPFFEALILGPDAVPPSELLGPDNVDRLVERVTHLYRKFMAQLINANMRTAPLYPHPTYNATIALPTARLKVNNGSKVTLQILLATMFICGSLAYLLTDMRHTLPHNPHTIAGTMSLLAGSKMCSRNVMPEGAEWMDDKSLKKAGVFEGYLFSLGWWEDRGQDGRLKKRRFGIDIGRAEKAV
jgi:Protein of unknown function (DUF3433)